jgi:hypothetical protein
VVVPISTGMPTCGTNPGLPRRRMSLRVATCLAGTMKTVMTTLMAVEDRLAYRSMLMWYGMATATSCSRQR